MSLFCYRMLKGSYFPKKLIKSMQVESECALVFSSNIFCWYFCVRKYEMEKEKLFAVKITERHNSKVTCGWKNKCNRISCLDASEEVLKNLLYQIYHWKKIIKSCYVHLTSKTKIPYLSRNKNLWVRLLNSTRRCDMYL